ncbi:MAG: hypothetical protein H7A25_22690 [Leptospiraceae bacterium]|nr:hypothetical protein [Leptospiraceae bacterium]MCP5502724.1 hypothetical protein [Leptospiraceae bacterium]
MKKILYLFLIVFSISLFSENLFYENQEKEREETLNRHGILVTILLKHDQRKTLDEINLELKQSGFWVKFPGEGMKIESWYVAMGLGHIITVRILPEQVRELNRIIERTAWKSFRTEFFLSYDFKEVSTENRKREQDDEKQKEKKFEMKEYFR